MRIIHTLIPLMALGLSLAGCEVGPKVTQQYGKSGLAMNQIQTASYLAKVKAENVIPPPPYELESRDGPLATSQYENHLRAVLGLPLGATDLVVGAR